MTTNRWIIWSSICTAWFVFVVVVPHWPVTAVVAAAIAIFSWCVTAWSWRR